MKRLTVILISVSFGALLQGQIIADHTIVGKYTDIPQQWIDSVKTLWVSITGASHAEAYRMGCWQLGQQEPKYASVTQHTGDPIPFRTTHLRISGATWGRFETTSGWEYIHGQEDWWTNETARTRIKAYLKHCHDNGPELYATMYGWSYDANFDNPPGGSYDPVYHVRWAGSTREGPDGNKIWGLDSGDQAITSNSVSMDTYISTVNQYIDFCSNNNIPTKIIWSTGAIDNQSLNWSSGERGYQQHLKWQHIRNYVKSLNSGYFIDYADILSYNNAGEQATTTWTDNNGTVKTFPVIHPENIEGGNIGHIGYNGALKLGKAIWWLLARMSGWDENTSVGKPISDEMGFTAISNQEVLEIRFVNDNHSEYQISLYNCLGQLITKKDVRNESCEFQIGSIPKGIYLVTMANSNNNWSRKIYLP